MGDYILDQSKHYAEFRNDAGFNPGFNSKDKVTLVAGVQHHSQSDAHRYFRCWISHETSHQTSASI